MTEPPLWTIILASADPPGRDWSRLVMLLFAVALLTIALCGVLLLIALVRRRRRLQALQDQDRRRRTYPDAWSTAGQRARTPTAAELDRARLDLEDTRMPDLGGDEPPIPETDPDRN